MSVIEIILEWVIFPLLDLLSGWHISGKWRISYLFPVATALGLGMWWAGNHFGIAWLLVFGVMITVLCGLASVLTFIPREVASWRDCTTWKSRHKSAAEDPESKKQGK